MIKNLIISILLTIVLNGMDFWTVRVPGMELFIFFVVFVSVASIDTTITDIRRCYGWR